MASLRSRVRAVLYFFLSGGWVIDPRDLDPKPRKPQKGA